MKPELLCSAPRSPIATLHRNEPFEVLPPVIRKREREASRGNTGGFSNKETERDRAEIDRSVPPKEIKLPRLPSIKHLQLDLLLPPHYLNDSTAYKHFNATSNPTAMMIDHPPPTAAPSLDRRQHQSPPKQASPLPSFSHQHHSSSYQPENISKNFRHIAPAVPPVSPPRTPPSASSSPHHTVNTQQQPSQEVLVPVVTNNFGFLETTFANVPVVKKTHRRRPANIDKSTLYCHNCGAKNTPEWRRGPMGPATLCNACGLAYAKRLRQEEDSQNHVVQMQMSSVGMPLVVGQCQCPQFAVYGRCTHQQQQQQQSPPPQQTSGMMAPGIVRGSMPPAAGATPVTPTNSRINSHTFHQYNPPSTQSTVGSFAPNNQMLFY